MRIVEVPYGTPRTIQLTITSWDGDRTAVVPGVECVIGRDWHGGHGLIRVGTALLGVRAAEAADDLALQELLNRNLSRLSWLIGVEGSETDGQRLRCQVHEFAVSHSWPGALDLGIDERVLTDVVGRFVPAGTARDDVANWLTDECLVPHPGTPGLQRAFLSLGGTQWREDTPAFRLHGRRVAIDVQVGPQRQMRISRVVTERLGRHERQESRIELLEGALRFADVTAATAIRKDAGEYLSAIGLQAGSFVRLWDDYNELETKLVAARHAQFGRWRYHSCIQLANGGWRFDLDLPDPEALSRAEAVLEIANDAALQAVPEDCAAQAAVDPAPRARHPQPLRAFSGTLHSFDGRRREITLQPLQAEEGKPPAAGYLELSATGDKRRLERRSHALFLLKSGKNQMPQLGLIIEGRATPTATRRTHVPWTPAATRVLGGPPTEQQTRAMDIALNTPDIALIQGPPGTGKTRLLAALQVRLAQIAEEHQTQQGHILLTSFQHDAVEHAAEATTINSLPAVKIGRKRNAAAHRDAVEVWRARRLEALRLRLAAAGGRPMRSVVRQLRVLQQAYARVPGRDGTAVALLRRVLEEARKWLPVDLQLRIETHAAFLERRSRRGAVASSSRSDLTRAVRALRCTTAGYADDGAESARRVLDEASGAGFLSDGEVDILAGAAASAEAPTGSMATLRDGLLDRLASDRAGATTVSDLQTEQLLAETLETLERRATETAEGPADALDELIEAFETDPKAVRHAIMKHTAVLAATCQQAGSRLMNGVLEELHGRAPEEGFESVIVDEAARANPLDLFIPLALARRRVILVGDHRQLPHILDREVEREISQSTDEAMRAALRTSLFETLFLDRLPKQEGCDHVARVVTLDTQFRMHPILGEFVSRAFYEPLGDPRLKPGKPAGDFAHALAPFAGKQACWYDIPARTSSEQERPGISKSRPCEAQHVAGLLERLLAQPEASRLSFGVITFYKAQEREIWKALAERGCAERLDDGTYQLLARWREAMPSLTEHVRIGTVDAFQGAEFDVVLVSMTRSNAHAAGTVAGARRRYGHLTLPNRLCVSLSRQKRLLVVVGDVAMLSHPSAETAIPGLVAFLRLCNSEHGIVYRGD